MVQIDIFFQPSQKKVPSKKTFQQKVSTIKKQQNDNLQIFNKYRNFSFPRQLVLTPRAKASA